MDIQEKKLDNGIRIIYKGLIKEHEAPYNVQISDYEELCRKSERATNFIMEREIGKRLRAGVSILQTEEDFEAVIKALSGFKFSDGWVEE